MSDQIKAESDQIAMIENLRDFAQQCIAARGAYREAGETLNAILDDHHAEEVAEAQMSARVAVRVVRAMFWSGAASGAVTGALVAWLVTR